MVKATLMARYNQPYSELDNFSYRDMLFCVRLAEAEDKYMKNEMDKQENKMKRLKSKFRRK